MVAAFIAAWCFASISGAAIVADGVGVPVDGYPSYDDRLQLVAINRVRADPNNPAKGTADPCSEEKPARPPVAYEHDLGQAARFHSAHLSLNGGGLSHATFCTLRDDLEATGCDGAAACSCVEGTECWSCETLGGCGSGPQDRVSIFGFAGGAAEVGAAGYGSGWDAVGGWVTENPCNSATLAHRDTVTGEYNVVGPGSAQGGACWNTYQFSEFANVDGLTIPRLASAVHRQGIGLEVYANWYDAGRDPVQIDVVVEGVCTPMGVDLGEVGNRTYVAMTEATAAPCSAYYVLAYDEDGTRVTYPELGSLVAGAGCEPDYVVEQAAADCDAFASCGNAACEGALGENCSSCPEDCDACTGGSDDGVDDGGPDDGGGPGDGGPGDGGPGDGSDGTGDSGDTDDLGAAGGDGACACHADASPPPAAAWLLGLIGLLARRRRQR